MRGDPQEMPELSTSPDLCVAPAVAVFRGDPSSPGDVEACLRGFSEISLQETNKTARMLNRIDNKYTMSRSALLTILEKLKADFKVLRIEGRSIFNYRSCYFDDQGRCFREHLQGKRQRFKVRTRLYVESDKAYFEVKLKGKRGQTDKSREACDQFHAFAINDDQQLMLRKLYEQNYGKTFHDRMTPALHVTYKRFTLVSASGGERITVDLHLGFETPSGRAVQVGDDFIIVETKSADGRGKSDQILKRNHIRQAEGCSKYCIGMALTGEVQRFNKFRPIVKAIRSRMAGPKGGATQRYPRSILSADQTGRYAGLNLCAR